MSSFIEKFKIDPFIYKWTVVLLGLFALQAASTYAVMASYDLLDHFKPALYLAMLYFSLALVIAIKIISYYSKFQLYPADKKNINKIKDDFQKSWFNVSYLFAFLAPMICLPTFMSLFSSMKSIIHLIQPFYLDEFLAKADRFLHFGVDPWRITHAVFGTAYLSALLNYFYNLWFFIMFGFTIWHVVNVKSGKRRMQYLLSFIIAWPLFGSLFAVFWSSAGPVYYGDVVGDHTVFGPMMESLREYHTQINGPGWGIFALDAQDMLWADYLKSDTNIGSGISAMPSMHVAIAALFYFSTKQLNRVAGYFMLGFLILIQIGSVHLGWHYALDGYISIILMYILWRITGFMVNQKAL
jgi:hypothetical protein